MSKANEYGVLVDYEEITLINDGKSVAIVRLAEHEGRWHWGIYVKYGSGGHGWAPSIDGDFQTTRAQAIKVAREFIKKRETGRLEIWPDKRPYLQPIIDACGPQQRLLFQEAS